MKIDQREKRDEGIVISGKVLLTCEDRKTKFLKGRLQHRFLTAAR